MSKSVHEMTHDELLEGVEAELDQQSHGPTCAVRVSGLCNCWKERVKKKVHLLATKRGQKEALSR